MLKYTAVALLAVSLSACAGRVLPWHEKAAGSAPAAAAEREAVAAHPSLVSPTSKAGAALWEAALRARGTRIIISTEGRSLWLLRDSAVLLKAPIAVGRSKRLVYKGKEYDFTTPIGKRKVLQKGTTPIWTPPDWHYFEIAVEQNLEAVFLRPNSRVALKDTTRIEVRKNQVGRVNRLGNFWPFTPGKEIIFDGKIFIPPIGTAQRKVPEVLGTHKLEMGDGYLIHGTNEEGTIGEAVSHGCIRMYNEDVARLFSLADVGTAIYVY
jgi:lipoprotein-anchoring transpeptidase ErfK/SrfK